MLSPDDAAEAEAGDESDGADYGKRHGCVWALKG